MRRLNITALIKNRRGDTIIEVLIAIAIVSLVLVGAYVSVNKNTAINQDTQERSVAQKLVEGQIELLRTQSAALAGKTCFDSNSKPASGATCNVSPDGGATYDLNIGKQSDTSYQVSANWDSLAGGRSNVTIYYRSE